MFNVYFVQMSRGVEWALHCCVLLHWAGPDAIPSAKLAGYHDLPPVYLNKQLQRLAQAGILDSISGPNGGFRLAKSPEQISLMDVVVAIEGATEAFRCLDIRAQGPTASDAANTHVPCSIATAMRRAENAWRASLAQQTIADIVAASGRAAPDAAVRARTWFGG